MSAMRRSFTFRMNPLGTPMSRPPMLHIDRYSVEIPTLVVSSSSTGEVAASIPFWDNARLISKKTTSTYRPIADPKLAAKPLRVIQNKYPSSSENHIYFDEAADRVTRLAGSVKGPDIEILFGFVTYVPVEAEAIELCLGGPLAIVEKGVRKIRFGEDGEINEESTACCAICLEEFKEREEAVRLTCSHVLHVTCLERWFHVQHHCPLCRREIMWHFASSAPLPNLPPRDFLDLTSEFEEIILYF